MKKKLTAFEYGSRAFERGRPCTPALDQEFLEELLKDLKVGEGIEVLDEWIKGWTNANLSTSVFT